MVTTSSSPAVVGFRDRSIAIQIPRDADLAPLLYTDRKIFPRQRPNQCRTPYSEIKSVLLTPRVQGDGIFKVSFEFYSSPHWSTDQRV